MSAYIVGVLVPLLVTLLLRNSKNSKKRGLLVDVGGEPGYAIRNRRVTSPVQTAWEGISSLAELFERSCKVYRDKHLLGTRKLIAREIEVTKDGRSFEKLHLGDYEWLTYGKAFEVVCNFASGLAQLGHKREERVAIFADTREEWFIALQGCFRRNVTVVTIYASLGEEALCHSLNETEVATVICGHKELKKIIEISGQLDTVKRVICMDDEIPSNASYVEQSKSWKITSFADVEILGRQNPLDADLPLSADIAVIMYTSGSTGLPKGVLSDSSLSLSLSLSASSVLLVSPQSSSMASAMSMTASPVHPPKITTVKALVESTGSSSIPSFYNFTPYLRDEPVGGDAPIAGDAEDSVPIIDISLLVSGTPEEQSQIIHQLSKACSDWGCFMVINHDVTESLTKAMIASFQEFFDLPEEEKKEYQGNHVMDPIRCGTGFNPSMDKANYWRDFLKCFAHPEFHTPNKPAGFSEIAREFSKRNREVVIILLKAISKSLGLEESYVEKAANFELGFQLLAANYYPTCPEPEKAIGIPAHYDHGLLTTLVNNGVSGLQVKHNEKWFNVNIPANVLFVQVADHLEILSNGKYKSIAHRALVNNKATRMSIALAHGPALDIVMRPAPELVDNESDQPAYVEMTYRKFLELQQTGRLRSKFQSDIEQSKAV